MACSLSWAILIIAVFCTRLCQSDSFTSQQEDEAPSNHLPDGQTEMVWYKERATWGVCVQTGEGKVAAMDHCLTRTTNALRHYARAVAKGHPFDFCRRIESSLSCVEEVTSLCARAMSGVGETWRAILDQLNCMCRSTTGECRAHMQCIDRELRGSLANHCDNMYHFNRRQTSTDTCFFAQENIDCKVALVWSACGAERGRFVHNVLETLAQKRKSTARCDISWNERYTGFRYHADCPSYFLSDMRSCMVHTHDARSVQFDDDNILIARDSPNDVRRACKYYRQYVICMRNKKKACPEGNRLMNTLSPSHRVYLLKMRFICERPTRREYTRKLPCLQETLRDSSWQNCSNISSDLKPRLERITAFEYYCKKHSPAAENVRAEIARLRACSWRVFSSHCGHLAGQLMTKFMDELYEDPEVLQLDYKPDCRLLRGSNRQSNFVPTLPYSEIRHRHHVKRTKDMVDELKYRPPSVEEVKVTSKGYMTSSLGQVLLVFAAFSAAHVADIT